MKTSIKIFIILAMAFAGAAGAFAATVKPSDKYVVRKVSTGEFNAVRTITSLDIVYTVGPRKVEIYAPDNLIQYIEVSIYDKELHVNYKEDMQINGNHKSCVRISAPDVSRFTTASSGEIEIKSPLSLKDKTIELHTTSAGSINAQSIKAKEVVLGVFSAGGIDTQDIRADIVKIYTSSAGDIETGEVVAGTEVKATVSSAGNITMEKVNAPSVFLFSSSVGNITASVTADDVNATTNSTGNIRVSGICSKASLTSSSMGKVDARNLKSADVNAYVSSRGDVYCWPLKQLFAYRSGTGSIRYKGKPATIQDASTARSGSVCEL